MEPNPIIAALIGAPGYHAGPVLSEKEIGRLVAMIRSEYLARIQELYPEHAGHFAEIPLHQYHSLAHTVDHSRCWPKTARVLRQEYASEIRGFSFMAKLAETFEDFIVTDEEKLVAEEFSWRIARPEHASDSAPVHADKWFWDLGHGEMLPGRERVKCWISLYTEPGKSGLLLYPGTHKRDDWKYNSTLLDGIYKPRIISDVTNLPHVPFSGEPGSSILFHDALLHAGMPNRGTRTRVSLEFTMMVRSHLLST